MNPLIQSKNQIILPVLIALTLGYFGLSPQARAVCQKGCLTNENTVLGDDALMRNTTGSQNTANGFEALSSNTDGSSNTASGESALNLNTTGYLNTANSYFALEFNTTGFENTAIGANALQNNTTGSENTASGSSALSSNTTGNSNIAIGESAGSNLTTGSNNIDIGSKGLAGESNTIRIGKNGTQTTTRIAGIFGATVPTGVAVIVDANGRLGTTTSSARFKDAIKPMEKASEAILALKPVTFRYKQELDPESIPQFGLVAEQVEKVNPDLVARDTDGKAYTVRYEAVNAMLLNEFLKEHRKVEQLKSTLAQQETTIAQQRKDFEANTAQQKKEIQALAATVKEQAAQIQKVSAQLEASKPAPRTVLNNR
jgi:Chaperone of endosialidase